MDRQFAKTRRSSRERVTGRCVGRPFFPRLPGWHGRGGISKFDQTALDGLAMAVKKLSNVANTAMSKFERLGGCVNPALALVEGRECKLHRLLDRRVVRSKHEGILPWE